MQQLHLVGFTTDLEGLIFSARKGAKSGGYLVMLDDRLQATIEDALRLRNGDDDAFDDGDGSAPSARPRRPRPQSTLSPREIQARLRAGSSIAEIAEEAGVDEEWVGRFAAPILAEQAQVVARARRLTFEKPRLGASALDLGEAVRWNLADRDIRFLDDDFDAAWSAYNLQGTSWVVRFHYASRGKRQTAEWEVDLRENELFARNRIASDLAYIDATRRRRRPPVLEPSARETPASAGSRRDSAPAAPSAPAAKPAPRLPTAAVAGRGSAGKSAATTGRGKATASSARGATAKSAGRGAPAKAAARPTAKATRKAAKATPVKAASPRRATTAAKAAKSVKAAKVTKATGTRRAAATKRGRATATKAAAKKPAPEHRGAASAASPPLEIAERRSHLARPASPMKSANPVPPRPGEEGFRVIGRQADDGRVRLPAPRPEALASRPRPPAPAPAPAPTSERAPERRPVNAPATAERHAPAPAPARPRAEAPAVEQRPRPAAPEAAAATTAAATPASRPPTPEERVARRLAARQNGGDAARSGRVRRPAPEQPAESHEPVWHGPGSGEPAPAVRIRADMAAATVRPHDHSGDAAADPSATPPRRRRERPLRAR